MTKDDDPEGAMRYLRTIPGQEEPPAGRVVVHNSVRPTKNLGSRGFRAWVQVPSDRLVRCDCSWAPALQAHYRSAAGA
jgi:hypothetical protein